MTPLVQIFTCQNYLFRQKPDETVYSVGTCSFSYHLPSPNLFLAPLLYSVPYMQIWQSSIPFMYLIFQLVYPSIKIVEPATPSHLLRCSLDNSKRQIEVGGPKRKNFVHFFSTFQKFCTSFKFSKVYTYFKIKICKSRGGTSESTPRPQLPLPGASICTNPPLFSFSFL